MFCQNCGKQIDDKAVICVHCGCETVLATNNNSNQNSMLCALLLWFFFGSFGAHRFYLGHTASGVIQLLCLVFCWLIFPAVILAIWLFIDLILLLTGGLKFADGRNLK